MRDDTLAHQIRLYKPAGAAVPGQVIVSCTCRRDGAGRRLGATPERLSTTVEQTWSIYNDPANHCGSFDPAKFGRPSVQKTA